MSLTIGIVGLPNVGKSTLFNALTKNDVLAANYPFATIEPNVGVVGVPDARLAKLAEIFGSQRDPPGDGGLRRHRGHRAAAPREGEGLGNKFLANIRESDAICQVIRAFKDPNVVHVDGKVSPKDDIETINTELILADLQTIEKALPAPPEGGPPQEGRRPPSWRPPRRPRRSWRPARPSSRLGLRHASSLRELHLLTAKPFLYVFNVDEDELADEDFKDELARPGRPRRGDLPRRQDRVRADRARRGRGAGAAPVDGPGGVRPGHPRPASASTPSACRPTSPPAPRRPAPGPSRRAPPPPRPPASSTPTSRRASSRPRSSPSTTWSRPAPSPRPAPRARPASRARTTSCRTATWWSSASTSERMKSTTSLTWQTCRSEEVGLSRVRPLRRHCAGWVLDILTCGQRQSGPGAPAGGAGQMSMRTHVPGGAGRQTPGYGESAFGPARTAR